MDFPEVQIELFFNLKNTNTDLTYLVYTQVVV